MTTSSSFPARWRAGLGVSAVLAVGFVLAFVTPYLSLDESRYGGFWPRRFWLLAHLVPGTLALLLTPVQVWLGLTRLLLRWHRRLGLAYVAAVTASSVAAIVLAVRNDVSWVYGLGLLGLVGAWLSTTGVAWTAARRHAIESHRQWMIRSAVVSFAFVWFRLVVGTTAALGIGTMNERLVAAAWACWSVPLLVAEVVLQLPRARRRVDVAALP